MNLICVEDGIDSSKDAGKLMISVLSAVQECMATSLLGNARMEVTIRIFIIMAANTEI